jgi:CRISPR-associated endonuclease Csn1
LIARHGKPHLVTVELARDLQLSEKQKIEVNRTIAKNTRAAEARSEKLIQMKQPDTGYNRLLLKLWEELNQDKPEDRVCIYSGRPINIEMLFSAEVDVDHILPWSKTLDDSQGNKILCLKSANRQKRNRAPADVPDWHGRYDEILARAARLPKNKRWRFAADAMEKFEADGGFLARQLTDTQYLSRMALEYLECLYPSEEPDQHGVLNKRNHVLVSPGRLTEMLRRNWGLNNILSDHNLGGMAQEKNRKDHRHHAIDAAVIGVTTRSLLQKISHAAGNLDDVDFENLANKMIADNPPWKDFRDDLKKAVNDIVVSHKPDHGTVSRKGYTNGKGQTAGRLHNDTAYGITGETDAKGNTIVVRRKPFMSLEPKDIPAIRDKELQAEEGVAGCASAVPAEPSEIQGYTARKDGGELVRHSDPGQGRQDIQGLQGRCKLSLRRLGNAGRKVVFGSGVHVRRASARLAIGVSPGKPGGAARAKAPAE